MELFPDFEFESKDEIDGQLQAVPRPPVLSDEIAEELVKKAVKFRKLEPWKRLEESDLFGIKDPESGELSIVSILGGAGEMFALHYYQPPESIAFWRKALRGIQPDMEPGLTSIRMLECEFLNWEMAEHEDVELFERFHRKPTKDNGLPAFKSYRPGYFPWFIEEPEARQLSFVFDLSFRFLKEVFPKIDDFYDWAEDTGELNRFPVFELKDGGEVENPKDWQVALVPFPNREPVKVYEVPAKDPGLKRLKKLPIKKEAWEIGAIFLPEPVMGEKRPIFAKAAFCLPEGYDAAEPVVFGPDDKSNTEALREAFHQLVDETGYLPNKLRVGSEESRLAFLSLVDDFNIEVCFEPLTQIPRLVKRVENAMSPQTSKFEDFLNSLPPEMRAKVEAGDFDSAMDSFSQMLDADPPSNVISGDFSDGKGFQLPEPTGVEHYLLRVEIDGIEGLTRSFSIPTDATFFHLHSALQDLFDWESCHLFEFAIGTGKARKMIDGNLLVRKLNDVIGKRCKKFTYLYDFGDSWNHTIYIEKVEKLEQPSPQPVAIAGEGAPPIEDCGGAWGYAELKSGEHWMAKENPEFWKEHFATKFESKDFEFDDAKAFFEISRAGILDF